jgi:hypothetical protein
LPNVARCVPAKWQRPLRRGKLSATALLIIDAQHDFCEAVHQLGSGQDDAWQASHAWSPMGVAR